MKRLYPCRLLAVILLLVLSACRGVPERADSDATWLSERQAFFSEHPYWKASGRMAIKDGQKGISVNFDWINNGDSFELRLRTSGGRWVMQAKPGYAELEGTRIGLLQAASPEPLAEQALGWSVPISYLQNWMRALPAPPGARLKYASDGSVLEINHEQWKIGYQTYDTVSVDSSGIESLNDGGTNTQNTGLNSVLLPTRLDATKAQYAIKVLISDWQL